MCPRAAWSPWVSEPPACYIGQSSPDAPSSCPPLLSSGGGVGAAVLLALMTFVSYKYFMRGKTCIWAVLVELGTLWGGGHTLGVCAPNA